MELSARPGRYVEKVSQALLSRGKNPYRSGGFFRRGEHRSLIPQGGIATNLYYSWSKQFLEAGKPVPYLLAIIALIFLAVIDWEIYLIKIKV